MCGHWELKPREQLDAYQCLQFGTKDDLGEEYCAIEEIIKFDVEDSYVISEKAREYFMSLIRQGITSGYIKDLGILSEEQYRMLRS